MANIKTSELTGTALDWAVAKCEGGTGFWYDTIATHWIKLNGKDCALRSGWAQSYLPSTDWAQGGPIIEKEMLCVNPDYPRGWVAISNNAEIMQLGSTALIAAMRCYVTSKLGNSVEIPDELINF